MIDHVNAFALTVRDVKKCAEFYRDKLGFELQDVSENFAYLTFGPKGTAGLALVSAEGLAPELADKSRTQTLGGLSRGYLAVFLENADDEYQRLKAKGVHFVTPPTTRTGGQRYAFFEDIEGNLWEISHFAKE